MGCACERGVCGLYGPQQTGMPVRSSSLRSEEFRRAPTERIQANSHRKNSSELPPKEFRRTPTERIQVSFGRKNSGELRPEESEQRVPGIGGGDCVVDIEASVVHVAISHPRLYLDAGAHARALEARFERADG